MEILQNQFESVARLQNSLHNVGILTVVIGGIAVAIWGNPRLTKDADLKVLLTREQAARLLAALTAEYRPLASDPEIELQRLGFILLRIRMVCELICTCPISASTSTP